MHHGYWQYCSGGECVVCNTAWPEKTQTPLDLYLKEIGYYERYNEKKFPTGVSGVELMTLRRHLSAEWLKYEGKDAGLEVARRGADQGYNNK